MFVDQLVRFNLIRSSIGGTRGRLIEIGCGSGELSALLESDGHTVFSCDMPTPFGRPVAKRAFLANGCALPIPSDSFDITVSSDVFEHVQPGDRATFLAEMMRVTKPGGYVVMTAFVNKTLSYRAWGATWLMASGYLPLWYCEHASIPTPGKPEIVAGLKGQIIVRRGYQRTLGLIAMWLQNAFKLPFPAAGADWLNKLDILGAATSYLIVVRKAPG